MELNRDSVQLLGFPSRSFCWSCSHLRESPHGRDIAYYTNTCCLKAAEPTFHSLSSILNPQAFLANWGGFVERFYCQYLCIWTVVLCFRSMTLRRPTVCSMWPWVEALKATVPSFWPIMTSASTVCGKMKRQISFILEYDDGDGVCLVFRQVLLQHTV